MAGKGDKWRKTDFKKFYSNFEEISWKTPNLKNCQCPKKCPNHPKS